MAEKTEIQQGFAYLYRWVWLGLWSPQNLPGYEGPPEAIAGRSALMVRLVALWFFLWTYVLPAALVVFFVKRQTAEGTPVVLCLLAGVPIFFVAGFLGAGLQAPFQRPTFACFYRVAFGLWPPKDFIGKRSPKTVAPAPNSANDAKESPVVGYMLLLLAAVVLVTWLLGDR